MMGEGSLAKPTWLGIPLRELSLAMLTVQYSSFVLLLHYSRVMPLVGGHRYLPSTAVFLHEVIKLAVCLTFALYETSQQIPRTAPATSLFGVLFSAIFSGDSWKMAIPACLYTLANNLQFIGISNLDAATFQVTYQVKIIVTAIFSVSILGQKLTSRKWLALLLLMLGVIIVSIPHGSSGPLSEGAHIRVHVPRHVETLEALQEEMGESGSSHLAKRSATYEGIEEDEMLLNPRMNAAVGLLAVMGLCIASGLGGVYFEKVLKEAPEKTSLWVRNVQLAIYSLFPALFIGVMFLDGETVAKNGFFDGYNWVVFMTIGFQAFGGIVAAFCIFYADNISKNFATSISMVISSLASFFFFDFEATGNFLAGTSLVLLATWLYNSQDVRSRARPPPPIKIHSFEKTTIDLQVPENDEKSIKIPVSPFRREASITTSRPPSPTQQHRIGTGKGYFEKHKD